MTAKALNRKGWFNQTWVEAVEVRFNPIANPDPPDFPLAPTTLAYTSSTSLTIANPTTGRFRFNTIPGEFTSKLAIHKTDRLGVDQSAALAILSAGAIFKTTQTSGAAFVGQWDIFGHIDRGAWIEADIGNFSGAGGTYQNSQDHTITLRVPAHHPPHVIPEPLTAGTGRHMLIHDRGPGLIGIQILTDTDNVVVDQLVIPLSNIARVHLAL